MGGTEDGVAAPFRVGKHAQCDEVVDIGELLALVRHLLVDGPQMLGAPGDLIARKTHVPKRAVEDLDGLGGFLLALGTGVLHHASDALVFLGIKIEEGEVLELPLDGAHTKPVGQRGIDVHRLVCLEDATIGLEGGQGPHVVQAIRKFDDYDAYVL